MGEEISQEKKKKRTSPWREEGTSEWKQIVKGRREQVRQRRREWLSEGRKEKKNIDGKKERVSELGGKESVKRGWNESVKRRWEEINAGTWKWIGYERRRIRIGDKRTEWMKWINKQVNKPIRNKHKQWTNIPLIYKRSNKCIFQRIDFNVAYSY